MDERFAYLNELSEKAANVEKTFAASLYGSKEGAISDARRRINPSLAVMLDESSDGFNNALDQRQDVMRMICDAIVSHSLSEATRITGKLADDDTTALARHHLRFVMDRLRRDAETRITGFQLDMKRIAILTRSMRDKQSWDSSASLLRARESVDNSSRVSVDSIGRKQRTQRYTRLLVRGLGLSVLVDSVVALSDRDSFKVMTFQGEHVSFLSRDLYPEYRERYFHPQAERYLQPEL